MLTELCKLLKDTKPFIIIAPPRTCSTALAKSLHANSAITNYIHEPCDRFAHHNEPISSITDILRANKLSQNTLIKEMTFQIGTDEVFKAFAENCKKPIIFLVRNPKLTLESRLRMLSNDMIKDPNVPDDHKKLLNDAISSKDYSKLDSVLTESVFPTEHTGWESLESQQKFCKENNVDYVIVDASQFRAMPKIVLKSLCSQMGINYEDGMLELNSNKEFVTGNLPEQSNWYSKVMASTTILKPSEEVLDSKCFPKRFQQHLLTASKIYNSSLKDERNLSNLGSKSNFSNMTKSNSINKLNNYEVTL